MNKSEKSKDLGKALRNNLLRRKMSKNTDPKKLEKIYEGKAKILYATDNSELIIQYFKDDATAFNNVKKDVIDEKGVLNNFISEFIMNKIAAHNVATHFVKRLNNREQLVAKARIIPLEIIVRNIAAGSMAKRLGVEEGADLKQPIFELCYKDDSLGDPLINDDHAINVLGVIDENGLQEIRDCSLKINEILQDIFLKASIKLVDFKIEFGFDKDGKIILADEISPDSCRLWDSETLEKLDKDRFRRDLGGLVDAYKEVAKRLEIKIN